MEQSAQNQTQNVPINPANIQYFDDYEIPPEEREACLIYLEMFNIEGRPGNEVVTEGQLKIFHAIIFRPSTRVQIITATQYGKSLIVALGCLIVSCIQKQLISVIAPNEEKAKIIMRYYVDHLGDHAMLYDWLESDTKLERLRQEESKERIILRHGGGIYVVSAQSRTATKSVEAAMGLGSKIVIGDEFCLVQDTTEATIFRMIAGKGKDAFYCKIGNPFYSVPPYTHFINTWKDPNYKKIFIDYIQGIAEGRYTRQFIEEARTKPLFGVLFECRFPSADAMIEGGWLPLLTEEDVERAFVEVDQPFGRRKLGADIAGGGRNYSTMVLRAYNMAEKVYKSQEPDTMLFVGNVLRFADNLAVKDNDIFVDSIGIGKGPTDRLREQRRDINAVEGSTKPIDELKFANKRAEMYWRLREWILAGGKLRRDPDWYQLAKIKYKVTDSSGKIIIMSKEKMLKEGIESPDVADGLSLTFARIDEESPAAETQGAVQQEEPNLDPYA